MKSVFKHLAAFVLTALTACERQPFEPDNSDGTYDRVMILVSAGFNNLSSYLKEDIDDLAESVSLGYIPAKSSRKALVVVSHHANRRSSSPAYTEQEPVNVIRIYSENGSAVRDTLHRISGETRLTETSVLREALNYVKEDFKSQSYGMVYSSHGTGWLPDGYYSSTSSQLSIRRACVSDCWPDGIPVKSIGSEVENNGSWNHSYEMDIKDFAAAIPMHLDYLVMDACLMGGVEFAYEMRQVTDLIGFSQAEVGAEGFCYETMAGRLLCEDEINVRGVCSDYYEKCDASTSSFSRSATVSLVDCSKIDVLARYCAVLFEKYHTQLYSVDPEKVQGFFRFDRHFFYDLRSILVNCGATDEELSLIDELLDTCILYKAATPRVLGTFDVKMFCGLSMYLPSAGNQYLDNYYKSLAWNKAAALVR